MRNIKTGVDFFFKIYCLFKVFDAGIAQYLLVDHRSHDVFFASLILGKPSLRCKLVSNEPKDVLDEEADNTFNLVKIL